MESTHGSQSSFLLLTLRAEDYWRERQLISLNGNGRRMPSQAHEMNSKSVLKNVLLRHANSAQDCSKCRMRNGDELHENYMTARDKW
jgi:hypothetical protein